MMKEMQMPFYFYVSYQNYAFHNSICKLAIWQMINV